MMNENQKNTRRRFLVDTALTASSFMIVAPSVLGRDGQAPSDKLNIAAIGVGGRGGHNVNVFNTENFIAFADVDDKQAAKSYERYDTVPTYKDYRVMLDKHEKEIDAVIVSTPDHTHAVAAMNAMKRKKHVFVEKPLAHSIYEVRELLKASRKYKVQTQLGNQGHSSNEIRNVCEWIADDAIGQVEDVQIWYTRKYGDGKPRPTDTPPIPETLDWDLWLGPVKERPYHPTYLPGSWRSWTDFGTGIMGDWVCHILDPAYWALNLDAPTSVKATIDSEFDPERFPVSAVIEFNFPARKNMKPVKVTWTYGKKPDCPLYHEQKMEEWQSNAGALLIGEKGAILHQSHGAGGAKFLPDELHASYKRPAQTIPRVPVHHKDWIRACKEGTPSSANFEYGARITEVALLGAIATSFGNETLQWDAKNMRFTNNQQANALIKPPYRSGWTL
jgi:predicted dehydrogenase